MTRTVRDFLSDVDDETFEQLSGVVLEFDWEFRTDLASVLTSWGAQVERLSEEAVAGVEPRDARTEHDFVGALYARDRVRRGLGAVSGDLQVVASRLVERFDGQFRDMTEQDTGGLLDLVLVEDVPDTGWWWRRVPRRGPARAGVDQIAATIARSRLDG